MLQMIWMPRALAVGACLAWLRNICPPFTVSHSYAPYFFACATVYSCLCYSLVCYKQISVHFKWLQMQLLSQPCQYTKVQSFVVCEQID